MTIAASASSESGLKSRGLRRVSPNAARGLLVLVLCTAATAGLLATGSQETSQALANAGAELANLLRAMTAIKAVMAAFAALAIVWRLGSPVRPLWLACYLAACAVMTAGVGLIWNLAHIGSGALMLHAGLLAAVVLFWRDPAVAKRIAALVEARRAAIASRTASR
jgi:alcohol dehydrogenase class IV